jgi:pimeloyl-ACP methyl ester carboxylesterase
MVLRATAVVRRISAAGAVAMLLVAAACATPARRFTERASASGLSLEWVGGTTFQHAVFSRSRAATRSLHVYLDGDGTPAFDGVAASDPTPRHPLVLELMARDRGPVLYLGRPCYHGAAPGTPCRSGLWTAERYSEVVVASMATALRRVMDDRGAERLVWFGYSGGGVLAMLLAPRFPETAAVVTVAANLDIDAWTAFHGYAALQGSLNPARQPAWPRQVYRRHYAGEADRVVPTDVVRRGAGDPSTVVVVPAYDHTCCWPVMWPAIVEDATKR